MTLSLFIFFIIILSGFSFPPSVVLSPVHAEVFEIGVAKKAPSPSAVLTTPGNRIVASKYVGNTILNNNNNVGYSGTIYLGTNPPQPLEVIFDTGSDLVVVTSDRCRGSKCGNANRYVCNSCSKTKYFHNITYGDGSWGSGPVVLDTLSLGSFIIQNQQVVDVTTSGMDLASYGPEVSGLVGLMPSSPMIGAVPPLMNLFKSRFLDMDVFSVYLAPTIKKKQGGSFLFGGIDHTKYVGELNQVPLSTMPGVFQGMWYVEADGAFVGDEPIESYRRSPWLFDTGTSFIAVPPSFAKTFHSNIPGAKYSAADKVYTVPCDGNVKFGVSFNGIKYEVPYFDYVAIAGAEGSSTCISLVMQGDFDAYILGDPFLKQVYAVYDFTPGKSRIGIAKINVTNTNLGEEGLSGGPPPGGISVSPLGSSAGPNWSKIIMSKAVWVAISVSFVSLVTIVA
ncbi:Vacuolar protease A [Entomortierella beljakovae]|nr:Vacuolar protease A [Entomortierella beljakovae]